MILDKGGAPEVLARCERRSAWRVASEARTNKRLVRLRGPTAKMIAYTREQSGFCDGDTQSDEIEQMRDGIVVRGEGEEA
jgi:hypothetical protein